MTETDQGSRDLTDAQILRREAAREAERVAMNLDSVAARIRNTAKQFDKDARPTAHIVADITNDYIQGIGQAGCTFWGMVHELARVS